MSLEMEDKKKYLYMHRTQGKGVEGVHINGINNAMDKLGYKGIIISPSRVVETGATTIVNTESNPKKGSSYLSFISKWMPELIFEILEMFSNIFLIRSGASVIKNNDIQFIYERYAIFGIAGVYLSQKYNIPIVLELNYTSKSNLVRKRAKLFEPLAYYVEKKLFQYASGIAVVSTKLKDQLIDKYSISEKKIVVTPNGCDLDIFGRLVDEENIVHKKQLEDKLVIGFVGGFYPWHGLDLLVNAFEVLAKEHPNILLLLIGDGPEHENISKLVQQKQLAEKVIFTGKINHHELPKYIYKFNIAVMPNSNEYGSPMKIFEYMALRKPYVAPDYPPIVEVTEGQGKIFKKNDLESFISALENYIQHPQMMEADGQKGRELIKTKYNWMENAKHSLSLL